MSELGEYAGDSAMGMLTPAPSAAPDSAAPKQRPPGMLFGSIECHELFGALAEAQGKIENPKRTKTAKVKGRTKDGSNYEYEYKYAPLDEIHDVIRAPLAEAGLAHLQFLTPRDGQWVMRTIVSHRSGQWIGCDYPIFQGRQDGAQGFASGVSYARRYGLMLPLGIAAEDEDDANIADGRSFEQDEPVRQRGKGSTRTAAAPPPPDTPEHLQDRRDAPKPQEDSAEKTAARQRIPMLVSKLNGMIDKAPDATSLTAGWADSQAELGEIAKAEKAGTSKDTKLPMSGADVVGHLKAKYESRLVALYVASQPGPTATDEQKEPGSTEPTSAEVAEHIVAEAFPPQTKLSVVDDVGEVHEYGHPVKAVEIFEMCVRRAAKNGGMEAFLNLLVANKGFMAALSVNGRQDLVDRASVFAEGIRDIIVAEAKAPKPGIETAEPSNTEVRSGGESDRAPGGELTADGQAPRPPEPTERVAFWGTDSYLIEIPKKQNNSINFQVLRDTLCLLGGQSQTTAELDKFEADNADPLRSLEDAFPKYLDIVRATFAAHRQRLAG